MEKQNKAQLVRPKDNGDYVVVVQVEKKYRQQKQNDDGDIGHNSMWISALDAGDNSNDGIQNKAHEQDHGSVVFLLSDRLFHLEVHKLPYVVAEFPS
jgi:hypothetical protein